MKQIYKEHTSSLHKKTVMTSYPPTPSLDCIFTATNENNSRPPPLPQEFAKIKRYKITARLMRHIVRSHQVMSKTASPRLENSVVSHLFSFSLVSAAETSH